MTTRTRLVGAFAALTSMTLAASLLSGAAVASSPAAGGDPDVTFSDDGFVELASPDSAVPDLRNTLSATPKNDGGVLVAATTVTPEFDLTPFAVELLPDGSYDESFGEGGVVYPDIPGWSGSDDFELSALEAAPLAGGVLVSGSALDLRERVSRDRLWLQRFTRTGEIDPDFAGNGTYRLPHLDLSDRVVTVEDRTILVCGASDRRRRLTVVRLDETGVGLPGFGDDGVSNTVTREHGTVQSCAVTPNGGVVVLQKRNVRDIWLTHLTATGELDTAFSDGGFAHGSVPDDSIIYAATVLSSGRAFLVNKQTGSTYRTVVSKRRPNATADPSFGDGGYSQLPLPVGAYSMYGEDVAAGRGGTVVVAGSLLLSDEDDPAYVARLLSDGSMDPAFGDDGLSAVEGPAVTFSKVDLYRDGNVLAQGYQRSAAPFNLFARLLG